MKTPRNEDEQDAIIQKLLNLCIILNLLINNLLNQAMHKISLFFLIGMMAYLKISAQTNPEDKRILDSLLENDEMLKMINNMTKVSSYFRVNMSIGNNLSNSGDKQIETLQNNNSPVFTSSASYYHKSGFGLSFTGFLFNENNRTNFYQYTLKPSFSYEKSKALDINLSYAHYFEKNYYSSYSSPVQDEFYGTFIFKRSWIKPGIATSYSTGRFNQVVNIDTTIKVLNRQVHIKYIDSAKIRLSSFSFAGTVEHAFTFYNLFSIKDGLILIPQLSLISAFNSFKVNHSSSLENYKSFTKKKIKKIRHFQSQSDNDKFDLQSLGLDINAIYAIGKFYVEPEMYFDYYLPATTDNPFSQIYSLNIGITF